jgi:hypothetical protein
MASCALWDARPDHGAHRIGYGVPAAHFKGAEMRCIAPFENFGRILIRVRMAVSLPEADLHRPPEKAKIRQYLPYAALDQFEFGCRSK